MLEHLDTFLYKLRFVFVGLLMLGSLLLLPFLLSSASANAQPTGSGLSGGLGGSPNAVTNGLSAMAAQTGQAAGVFADSVERAASGSLRAMASGASATGQHLASGGRAVGRGLGAAASLAGGAATVVGHGAVSGLAFTARLPGNIVGFVSNTAVVSAVIKPADSSDTTPVIDQKTADIYVTKVALAKLNPASPGGTTTSASLALPATASSTDSTASWPIHGAITTLFGVPHWPYQPTHTGIDISDGQRSGVTAVKPYKPGKVVEASWSNAGLGNHVVIDNGSGITSVYGHMYAISVTVGQMVTKDTTLGTEGSTGASTGTHLHFEVRLNGTPVNPFDYVAGQP